MQRERLEEVQGELENPDIWNDPEKAQRLGKERARLETIVNTIVKLDDGSSVHLDLDALGDLVRPECIPCTDFSCYTADISVGGIGSPDGYTTTMIRNQQAKGLVEEAIANEYIERNIDIREDSLVASVEKMAWRKYNRGIEKLKQLGVAI